MAETTQNFPHINTVHNAVSQGRTLYVEAQIALAEILAQRVTYDKGEVLARALARLASISTNELVIPPLSSTMKELLGQASEATSEPGYQANAQDVEAGTYLIAEIIDRGSNIDFGEWA